MREPSRDLRLDERSPQVLQSRSRSGFLGHELNREADPAARDGALHPAMRNDGPCDSGRRRESDAQKAAGIGHIPTRC